MYIELKDKLINLGSRDSFEIILVTNEDNLVNQVTYYTVEIHKLNSEDKMIIYKNENKEFVTKFFNIVKTKFMKEENVNYNKIKKLVEAKSELL